MRHISFALTTTQFLDGTKTVTRRNGWQNVKAGDRLMAVEKGMGLKKGEKINRLGEIEIIDARREPLDAIYDEPNGCAKEGFPNWEPQQFIDFYCEHNGNDSRDDITRIEFRRVP
jgi:hypothetical protein